MHPLIKPSNLPATRHHCKHILGGEVAPMQASCPTANCTWPSTPSVAVCGACTESEFVTLGCNTNCSSANYDCKYSAEKYCNYSLPLGKVVQLYDFVGKTLSPAIDGVGFQVVPSFLSFKSGGFQDNRAYLANFELFGVPFGFTLHDNPNTTSGPTPKPQRLDLKATECSLWMCVQAYNTSTVSSTQHDGIIGTFDYVNGTDWAPHDNSQATDIIQLPEVPANLDPNGLTNFTVNLQAGYTLQAYFYDKLRGNVTIASEHYTPSSDLVYGAW
jgi:hypothetical protein